MAMSALGYNERMRMLGGSQHRDLMALLMASALLTASGCGSSADTEEPTCSPAESCNPAECPEQRPPSQASICKHPELSCSYQAGNCVAAFECAWYEYCKNGTCAEVGLAWREDLSCPEEPPGPVPCTKATNGAQCAEPGERCSFGADCRYDDLGAELILECSLALRWRETFRHCSR